jgi:hypothetical protein
MRIMKRNSEYKNLIIPERADSSLEPLGAAMGLRLPLSVDKFVRSLPNKQGWIRRVITEAAQRELMEDKNNDI